MTDPFGQPTGGGNYPKLDDLEGNLILLRPSKVETVPGYQGKGTTDRATADCWVFGPNVFGIDNGKGGRIPHDKPDLSAVEKYDDMYFSQAGIVPSCKQALKPDGLPYVLGVVSKFPSKKSKEAGIDTPEKLEDALTKWLRGGGKGEKPQFAWGLGTYNDDQAKAARELIDSFNRATDPFQG